MLCAVVLMGKHALVEQINVRMIWYRDDAAEMRIP